MTFKYNTRQFIKEMQCRPCLWNVNNADYNDKAAREIAWLDIARIMYDEWDDLDLGDKTEKVKDLQKKWKGLRDYHTRVQNKKYTQNSQPELLSQRGRKRPFLDMLNFLSAKKKKNDQSSQNQQLPESNTAPATIKPSNATVTSYKQAKQGPAATRPAAPQSPVPLQPSPMPLQPSPVPMQPSPMPLQPSPTQETTERSPNDPDANFLFSILPDMKSMDPAQNFEFRFQVMKLIKDLKYNQHNSDDYEVPIFNESAVSPPEYES